MRENPFTFTEKPKSSPRPVVNQGVPGWAVLAIVFLVAAALSGGLLIVAYNWTRKAQPAPVVVKANAVVKAAIADKKQSPDDKDKAAFVKIVRENADDPAGFDLISWGDRKGNERRAIVRCNILYREFVQRTSSIGGARRLIGAPNDGPPVSRDEAILTYQGNRIVSVHFTGTSILWQAR